MHAYTRQIATHIGHTIALTMQEEGAYNRLLDQHYNTERPLPMARAILYRLARAESAAERQAVESVLARCFTLTPDGYVERNVMEDVAACREKEARAIRAAAARRSKRLINSGQGGEASCKTDASEHANPDAKTMQNACNSDAHQTPFTNLQAPDPTPTLNPSQEIRDEDARLEAKGVVGGGLEKEKDPVQAPSLRQLAEAIRQGKTGEGRQGTVVRNRREVASYRNVASLRFRTHIAVESHAQSVGDSSFKIATRSSILPRLAGQFLP